MNGFAYSVAGCSSARRTAILARAGAEAVQPWEHLPATAYLRYRRDGDRSTYEVPYFRRRRRLGTAALAWALTGEATYGDCVADGVWALCEESTWCVPAHQSQPDQGHGLPAHDRIVQIDLFNSESAQVLAEVCQLAAPALSAIDPRILPRARAEILRRVVEPLLAGEQPWWFAGRNNWSPWCAANAIAAAGWVLDERPEDYRRLADILGGVVDRFVAGYGADGGCDEWVSYWSVSAGAMLRFREEVRVRTGAGEGWWQDAKIAAMLRFPSRMHLGGGWFPSFSDSVPRTALWSSVLRRAAVLGADDELARFSRIFSDPGRELDETVGNRITGCLITQQLLEIAWSDNAAPVDGEADPQDAWLPDLQAMRVHGGGFAVAAKGGHNAENHNHNDVGQTIVHWRGRPVLVDVGRGEYTAQTFSAERYKLWWTRGSGHAVPIVDGVEQAPGRQCMAREVIFSADAAAAELRLDLAACYPVAGLGLTRRVRLDRRQPEVLIADRISGVGTYELPLTCAVEPQRDGDGWRLGDVRLTTSAAGTLEAVDLRSEPVLQRSWPGGLWHLRLRTDLPPQGGEVQVSLRPRG